MGDTAGGLQVDYAGLESAMTLMQAAIDEYAGESNKVFNADMADMDEMNSDFVEKFSRTLKCLKDNDIRKLVKEMKRLRKDTEIILTNLRSADEAHQNDEVEVGNG